MTATVWETIFCVVVSLGLPVMAAILCGRHGSWKPVCVGALTFVVSALILEAGLHALVFSLVPSFAGSGWRYGVYACLAAGFFEETGRYIALTLVTKGHDSTVETGFAYGVGHGGIEAILVAGLTALAMLFQLAGPDAARVAEHWEPMWSGIERMSAMGAHVALSILMWMVATELLPRWGYPLAIALHALFNAPAMLSLSLPVTELCFALGAVAICGAVWLLYRHAMSTLTQKEERPAP